MELKTHENGLRQLIADSGKILVSKEKDEEGEYIIKTKDIYLGIYDNVDNYDEIDDENDTKEDLYV